MTTGQLRSPVTQVVRWSQPIRAKARELREILRWFLLGGATREMLEVCRIWRATEKSFLAYICEAPNPHDITELRKFYRARMRSVMAYNVWENRLIGALFVGRALIFVGIPYALLTVYANESVWTVASIAMFPTILASQHTRLALRKRLQISDPPIMLTSAILAAALIYLTMLLLPDRRIAHLGSTIDSLFEESALRILPAAVGLGILIELCVRSTRFVAYAVVEHRRVRRLPIATAQLCLDVAISELATDGALNGTRGKRRRLCNLLALAKKNITTGIPQVTGIHGQANVEILAQRCREAGDYLDSLQLWIALPRSDTVQQLRNALRPITAALLTGDFDDFPRFTTPEVTSRQRRHQAARILRSLIAGALPSAIVFGVGVMGLKIQGTLGDAVVIFCIAWAAVTYLAMLDPAFNSRISAIRDLMNAIGQGDQLK